MESLWAFRLNGLYYATINFNRGEGGRYTTLGKDLAAAIPNDAAAFAQWRSTIIQRLKSLPPFKFRNELVSDSDAETQQSQAHDEIHEYRDFGQWPFEELNLRGAYVRPAGNRRCSRHPPSYYVTEGYHYTFDFDRNRWSVGHGHHAAAAHFRLDGVPDDWVQYVDRDEGGYTCLSPFTPVASRADMVPEPRRVPGDVLTSYAEASFEVFEIPLEFEEGSEVVSAAMDELRMKAFLRFCSVQQLSASHFDFPVYKEETCMIYSDGMIESALMLLQIFNRPLVDCLDKPGSTKPLVPTIRNFDAVRDVFESGWLRDAQEVFYVLAPHLDVPDNLQWALVEAIKLVKRDAHLHPTMTTFRGIVCSIFHVVIVEVDVQVAPASEGETVASEEENGSGAHMLPLERTFKPCHTSPIPVVTDPRTRSFHPAGARALRYACRRCSVDTFCSLKVSGAPDERGDVDVVSRLPHEIQQHILYELPLRDMGACMRVSRAWYHLALPLHDGPRIGSRYAQRLVARHAGGRAYAFLSYDEATASRVRNILIVVPGVANHPLWTDTLPSEVEDRCRAYLMGGCLNGKGVLHAFEVPEGEYYRSFREMLEGPMAQGRFCGAHAWASWRELVEGQRVETTDYF